MMQANLDYLEELADGDEAFKKEFIAVLKSEFPLEQDEYLNHIKNANYTEAALIVHKLKHKFNVLGLRDGYRIAIDHEENLKKDDLSLVPQFFAILEHIKIYLKDI